MPFDARVVQVVIASPGDVDEERRAAVEVINDWNRSFSSALRCVLLPRRWETHSAPEMGDRPQAILNRQVIDQGDLMIALFWTRLGTPTGEFDSGTCEEIQRAAKREQLVMVYFSRVPINPDELDLEQVRKLREFKELMRRLGLVENYDSTSDFKEKLGHQLNQQVRRYLAKIDSITDEAELPGVPQLGLRLESESKEITALTLWDVTCSDLVAVPDFVGSATAGVGTAASVLYSSPNANYYRELVRWFIDSVNSASVHLVLTNDGETAIRDLRLEFRVSDESFVVLRQARPQMPLRESDYAFNYTSPTGSNSYSYSFSIDEGEIAVNEQTTDDVKLVAMWPVLQSGREVSSAPFFVRASNPTTLAMLATVYSNFAKPFVLGVEIPVEVGKRAMTWREIVEAAGEVIPEKGGAL